MKFSFGETEWQCGETWSLAGQDDLGVVPLRMARCNQSVIFRGFPLASLSDKRIYRGLDALARAYGPWWLCNDVTRPFWSSGRWAGPEREVGMVAIRLRGVVPCLDAHLRGTRLRGRGNRIIDPSSLS